MQLVDEQLAMLEKIDVPLTKRPDFDAFWEENMRLVRTAPLDVTGGVIDYPFPDVEVRDLRVSGIDGTPIAVWLLLPAAAKKSKVPAIVVSHGAGGSRGIPPWYTHWLIMGAAVIVYDFRMQGGDTGSNTGFTGANSPGWWNMGVADPKTFYYRFGWTDGLRMIELAARTPQIDAKRIAVEGGSQGGGAALAHAALDQRVALCMADVPSNCWVEKRLFARSGSLASTAGYLKDHPHKLDEVVNTLSYFDNINLVGRIRCPVLASVGLKDPVCPPENAYAALNKITSEKKVCTYAFGEHEGGAHHHAIEKLRFVKEKFGL